MWPPQQREKYVKLTQSECTVQLLGKRWAPMARVELEAHLKRLLTAELHCYPCYSRAFGFTPQFAARCRWKRQAVVRRLLALGSNLSELATGHALPRWEKWPGTVGLVETRGWTLATKKDPRSHDLKQD